MENSFKLEIEKKTYFNFIVWVIFMLLHFCLSRRLTNDFDVNEILLFHASKNNSYWDQIENIRINFSRRIADERKVT